MSFEGTSDVYDVEPKSIVSAGSFACFTLTETRALHSGFHRQKRRFKRWNRRSIFCKVYGSSLPTHARSAKRNSLSLPNKTAKCGYCLLGEWDAHLQSFRDTILEEGAGLGQSQ